MKTKVKVIEQIAELTFIDNPDGVDCLNIHNALVDLGYHVERKIVKSRKQYDSQGGWVEGEEYAVFNIFKEVKKEVEL